MQWNFKFICFKSQNISNLNQQYAAIIKQYRFALFLAICISKARVRSRMKVSFMSVSIFTKCVLREILLSSKSKLVNSYLLLFFYLNWFLRKNACNSSQKYFNIVKKLIIFWNVSCLSSEFYVESNGLDIESFLNIIICHF